MRLLIAALLIFALAGCPIKPKPPAEVELNPILAYTGQYIVEFSAQGPFSPYPRVAGDPVLPPGSYAIDAAGNYALVTDGAPVAAGAISEYDPDTDLCKKIEAETCSPNFVLSIEDVDPLVQDMWGLNEAPGVRAVEAWEQRKDSPEIKIAVIDTGVSEHEDLTIHEEYNCISQSEERGSARDDNGHGTHVAGSIAANGGNGVGISGVSQRAKLGAFKFLNASGSGSTFDAIRCINEATRRGYDILNNSWGGRGASSALASAVQSSISRGTIFVAAAGNSGLDVGVYPHYPSNYAGVVSVGSVNSDGRLSSFSNFSSDLVHVAAPGGSILSTVPGGGYRLLSGTSMATPHVSGLAALLSAKHSSLPKLERAKRVKKILFETVRPIHTDKIAHGVIDAVDALKGEYSEPTPTPITCKAKQCKRCLRACGEDFKCNCKKWQKCKKECRKTTSCGVGCK